MSHGCTALSESRWRLYDYGCDSRGSPHCRRYQKVPPIRRIFGRHLKPTYFSIGDRFHCSLQWNIHWECYYTTRHTVNMGLYRSNGPREPAPMMSVRGSEIMLRSA